MTTTPEQAVPVTEEDEELFAAITRAVWEVPNFAALDLRLPDLLQKIARHRLTQWQPIATAPRDGTLFDIRRNGRRYVDCHFDPRGALIREHGYPAITQVFIGLDNTEWMPRPDDCTMPYSPDAIGKVYVP